MPTKAYAAPDATTPLGPTTINRRAVGERDVAIDILYCGVCHSDLHTVRSEWPGTLYPCVPGHEIVGRVRSVGNAVTTFRPGDIVGVGCMVDSCRRCVSCEDGVEQYCEHGFTATYNGNVFGGSDNTFGGYATDIVVDQHFVLKVSHEETDLAGVAPLLCAGITTWSPLRHWKVGPGMKVGVVGLGGLGHMAVKLAAALGAEVTVFTTSPNKADDARKLGAAHVVVSKDEAAMKGAMNTYDFILNTVAAAHNLDPFVGALTRDGTMCLVGVPSAPHPSPAVAQMIFRRKQIAGSLIGGIRETQEMLDFCAEKGITSDIEMIRMDEIESAYERMLKSDVKYRFVIDMGTLR